MNHNEIHAIRPAALIALAILFILSCSPEFAQAAPCNPLPPIDPNKTFVTNFTNPCYAIPLTSSGGGGSFGDPNATYDQFYYAVTPGYELIVMGTFPNARLLSATVYDTHTAITSIKNDQALLPLTSSMVNPLLPGNHYVPNQQYGIKVSLGGGAPQTVSPGCSVSETNIEANTLDASMIHSGLSWTGYPGLPPGFPPHITGPNSGGQMVIRKYVDISESPTETVIVRSLTNGCAIGAQDALAQGIIRLQEPRPSPLFDLEQVTAHVYFSQDIKPSQCWARDPKNAVVWMRPRDFIQIDNGDSAGLSGPINATRLQEMLSGQTVMRIRFLAPTIPTTPCETGTCTLTGTEQLRYFSIAFQFGSTTLTAVKDSDLVKDPNGYVSLIVSMGAPKPAQATPENYYTYLDLTTIRDYDKFSVLLLRNFSPGPGFMCSSYNVPFHTMEHHSDGGFMGKYVPTVDFLSGANLPAPSTPPSRNDTCGNIPTEPSQSCPF